MSNRPKRSGINLFTMAKFLTIQNTVAGFLKVMKTNKVVSPDYGHMEIPINILEAKALDFERGNSANAKVALTLAKQFPGGKKNTCTGAGASKMSQNGTGMTFIC